MVFKKTGEDSEIRLTAPWDRKVSQVIRHRQLVEQLAEEMDSRNVISRPSDEMAQMFLQERSRVHETYIKEQERTKRIGMVLAAILILGAAALILFAPPGRETPSYWIGAALVVFAAGAMGYQRIWGKSKNLSFGADQDRNDL